MHREILLWIAVLGSFAIVGILLWLKLPFDANGFWIWLASIFGIDTAHTHIGTFLDNRGGDEN